MASERDPEIREVTCPRCGTVNPVARASNAEMRELRAPPFKLPLERDIWFEPKVLSEIMEAE